MSRPNFVKLGLEAFEKRLCPSSMIATTPFIIVLQTTGGNAEAAKLVQQVQSGEAVIGNLIASQAGSDDFAHVIADHQLLTQIASNGALYGIEQQVGITAQNYINNPSPATGNSLNLAIESAAFAYGVLVGLANDYQISAALAQNSIANLGPGAQNAVNKEIQSVQDAAKFIINNVQQYSISVAAQNFLTPNIPGPAASATGTSTGTFDPDNDGDDDTGMAGY